MGRTPVKIGTLIFSTIFHNNDTTMIKPYHLHIEPTTRCNARCPQCPRTDISTGDTKSNLNLVDLAPETLEKILSHECFDNVLDILINGTYGDIVMHPRPLEFLQVCASKGNTKVNTNGSGLKKQFWESLAKLNITVEFSIEGMSQQTHEVYRRNTNLNKILENAKAFIDAGGKAIWAMTVFKHNQHEVDECEEFANYLGFKDFCTRDSKYRFDGKTEFEHNIKTGKGLSQAKIETPEMSGLDWQKKCHVRFGKTLISLFISADQRLYPCCFTHDAEPFNLKIDLDNLESQIKMVYDEYIKSQFHTPKGICSRICNVI